MNSTVPLHTAERELFDRAIHHGRRARQRLDEAAEHFQGARRWGLFDLVGGRLLGSLFKHGRLEEAGYKLVRAQGELRRMRAACERLHLDVPRSSTNARVGGAEYALDVWLDNPVTDLLVQSKIRRLRREVDLTRLRLERALGDLRARRAALQTE